MSNARCSCTQMPVSYTHLSAPSLEDGTMLKVLTDWRSWVDEGWCRSFDATNAGDTMQQLFFQGKLGAFFNSSAGMRSITENCAEAGIELGVAYYPCLLYTSRCV